MALGTLLEIHMLVEWAITMNLVKRFVALLPLPLLIGCSSQTTSNRPVESSSNPTAKATELIPAGKLQRARISYELAIYYLPKPTTDPSAVLEELLRTSSLPFTLVPKIDSTIAEPMLATRLDRDVQEDYAPPSPDVLKRFGRGIGAEQAAAVRTTEAAFIMVFDYSQDHCWDGLRASHEMIRDLARRTDGLIWDKSTRELFSPDAWDERRLHDWTTGVPEVDRYTVIHAYQSGDFIRGITLGMEKFGLPDIVVDGFSWSLSRNMGHVINLFGQALAEGAEVKRPGEFDLNFREIKHSAVRDPQLSTLKPNATGIALLTLRKGVWEEGDPHNDLVEITFERGKGPDEHAHREQVISQAFGTEDSISYVKHDTELNAASTKARKKLPELREKFNQGLVPGDLILVKAPFPTPDGGKEWMWVEVIEWKDEQISGLLQNEPYHIPTLHAGQKVNTSQSDVFDYIFKHADGSLEGNETAKLLEAKEAWQAK